MKLKFKRQQFQADAVNAVVDCFEGQPNELSKFMLDKGIDLKTAQLDLIKELSDEIGFKNKKIVLSESEVFANIKKVQQQQGIRQSTKLEGKYNLTIEMETGTGKTYAYIKTMFELNQKYGWSKFIIVVPSIAIREGVFKSFQITEEHFMQEYGKKARYFVYNSKQLHNIESFASDSGVNVIIINSQAFNSRGKDARRIYMELDEFQTRRPIDVIARANPIVIIDEPQSVEGARTKESLTEFKPLFTLRYSATHKEEYNKIYRLDALDAYNKKLVKKIKVKGITVKGTTGTEGYLYFEGIDLSQSKAPTARIEFETKTKSGIKKETKKLKVNDNLFEISGNLEQYKHYKISEINGYKNTISFSNGVTLKAGEAQGDINDLNIRRIQIRETIKSHLEKEHELYKEGIKVLSLFFIDEVAKYRQYDNLGNESNGEYAKIFEEEYNQLFDQYITLFDKDYVEYLKKIKANDTHKGYFSIDKKNRLVDPKVAARESESDDIDAYDLIMKEKERLLGFDEPTRFIFSHSALREGWDNPNVFQICTLKHSVSTIRKRQEVGRGLRLCVNQSGDRIDSDIHGVDVHDINILTVIASESYETFAKQLQNEIAETLSDRPQKADIKFFVNKVVENANGAKIIIDEKLANKIHHQMIKKDYIDDENKLTQTYFDAVEKNTVELPDDLKEHKEPFVELIKSIYVEGKTNFVSDERKNNIPELKLNENFKKKEFQELWNKINHKSVYTVRFETKELIEKCVNALNCSLTVSEIQFKIKQGELGRIESKEQLKQGEAFKVTDTQNDRIEYAAISNIKYDLIGKMINETKLTRKTIVAILKGIRPTTFILYKKNPEEFIIRASRIINEQKATTIIERITYDPIDEQFDSSIFTWNTLNIESERNAMPVSKHICDYVITDSKIEKEFAKSLDTGKEVCVFAKLPRGFYIPTPVGDYNPDWAIVLKENNLKYIYFIAETKGTMDTLELREVEKAKIHCARKHFEKLNCKDFKYDVVDNYQRLMDIINSK